MDGVGQETAPTTNQRSRFTDVRSGTTATTAIVPFFPNQILGVPQENTQRVKQSFRRRGMLAGTAATNAVVPYSATKQVQDTGRGAVLMATYYRRCVDLLPGIITTKNNIYNDQASETSYFSTALTNDTAATVSTDYKAGRVHNGSCFTKMVPSAAGHFDKQLVVFVTAVGIIPAAPEAALSTFDDELRGLFPFAAPK